MVKQHFAMKKISYIILCLLGIVSMVTAQNTPVFKAEVSKNTIGINERLRVDFTFNENGDDFNPPSFEHFSVMGPSVSISNSWINGKQSFSKTFTYILEPHQQGTLTIGSASIVFQGKTYETQPISVKVVEAVKNPSIDKTPENIADESVFVRTEISTVSPYLNEAVNVVYRVYVRKGLGISDVVLADVPSYQNFWNHNFPIQNYQVEETTLNGEPFLSFAIKRVLLYPQKSGSLSLEPLKVRLLLTVPTQQRDFFGRRMVSEVERTVSSKTQTLQVKPLPEEGKPANFSGAVGNFSLQTTLSKNQLNANESLQAQIQISGEGNFKLFSLPKMNFPSSLEVYDPETSDKIETQSSGMKGSITQSYTVVAQHKGNFPLPSVSFSFFNPKTKKYQTIQSQPLSITVVNGAEPPIQVQAETHSSDKNNNSFKFIKLQSNFENSNTSVLWGSLKFYLLLAIAFGAIPIALLWHRFQQKRNSDISGNKARSAHRLAKKYLSEAKKQIGSQERFYESLERSFHNYLKARLHMETGELSKDKITELLQKKGMSDSVIEAFISLLKNCEFARYAAQSSSNMASDYEKAVQLLSRMDKQL